MITSRQIVDIINDELQKNIDESARVVLKRVKDKIEILEEIDYVNQYKQPVYDDDKYRDAEKFFK